MSEFLLIVPEVLAHESFENCSVVAHRSCWPIMPEVSRVGEAATPFVAATCSTNPDSVRQMLSTLTSMRQTDRRLVFADNAIPGDLGGAFPKPLCAFVQRVRPCDLMCVSATVARQTVVSDTMLMSLFSGELQAQFIDASPCMERFPDAGAGNNAAGCGVSAAALTSAIDRALSAVKLSTPERMCVTAGILLLWDQLSESHEISQTMEGCGTHKTADYWHGIMHRREPDAGNAAYWFRRVGLHPAMTLLAANLDRWMAETGASDDERALARRKTIADGRLDPFAVIELSTEALKRHGQLEDRTLRRVQYLEILNLLSYSTGRSELLPSL